MNESIYVKVREIGGEELYKFTTTMAVPRTEDFLTVGEKTYKVAGVIWEHKPQHNLSSVTVNVEYVW